MGECVSFKFIIFLFIFFKFYALTCLFVTFTVLIDGYVIHGKQQLLLQILAKFTKFYLKLTVMVSRLLHRC